MPETDRQTPLERSPPHEASLKGIETAKEERPCPLCGDSITSYDLVEHLQECPGR